MKAKTKPGSPEENAKDPRYCEEFNPWTGGLRPSKIFVKANGIVGYHLTPSKKVRKILKKGLLAGSYLSTKLDLSVLHSNYGDATRGGDYDDPLVVLKVVVPKGIEYQTDPTSRMKRPKHAQHKLFNLYHDLAVRVNDTVGHQQIEVVGTLICKDENGKANTGVVQFYYIDDKLITTHKKLLALTK